MDRLPQRPTDVEVVIDLRWQDVKCKDCGVEYQCTPTQDYFHPTGFTPLEKSTTNGYCWNCFMRITGMNQQEEPPYQ